MKTEDWFEAVDVDGRFLRRFFVTFLFDKVFKLVIPYSGVEDVFDDVFDVVFGFDGGRGRYNLS